jgi:hypothetical protein
MTLEEFVEEMIAMGRELVNMGYKRVDELRQFYGKVDELSRLLDEAHIGGELSTREYRNLNERLTMIMDMVKDASSIGKRAVDALNKFLMDVGGLLKK